MRMLETVVSRDKNWIYWKANGCPLMTERPVPSSEYLEARQSFEKVLGPKRQAKNNMSSLNLSFLGEGGFANPFEKLEDEQQ